MSSNSSKSIISPRGMAAGNCRRPLALKDRYGATGGGGAGRWILGRELYLLPASRWKLEPRPSGWKVDVWPLMMAQLLALFEGWADTGRTDRTGSWDGTGGAGWAMTLSQVANERLRVRRKAIWHPMVIAKIMTIEMMANPVATETAWSAVDWPNPPENQSWKINCCCISATLNLTRKVYLQRHNDRVSQCRQFNPCVLCCCFVLISFFAFVKQRKAKW